MTKNRHLHFLFTINIILMLSGLCFAQSITWQRTYTFNQGDEAAQDICPADNNNYYLTGYKGPMSYGVFVLKINQFGDTLWSKFYGYGIAYTIEPTND